MHDTQDALATQAQRQKAGDFAPLLEQRKRSRRGRGSHEMATALRKRDV
jgi:hypothetical protein